MTNTKRVTEAAAQLGVSPSQMRWLADSGVIPSQRTPGRAGAGHRMFDEDDLIDAKILKDQGKSWDWIKDYFTERTRQEIANG